MRWQGVLNFGFGVGAALASVGTLAAQTQTLPGVLSPQQPPSAPPMSVVRPAPMATLLMPTAAGAPTVVSASSPIPDAMPATLQSPVSQKVEPGPKTPEKIGGPSVEPGKTPVPPVELQEQGPNAPGGAADEPPLGPTPLLKVGILQDWIYGPDAKDAPLKFAGWADFDYTYRSTGSGQNNVAPVMNRFGNEALVRQLGLLISKPLDSDSSKCSWGFNVIAIAGADAAFLYPTEGFGTNTNSRFAFSFTDLNLTAHLPILTEGGVDIKAGRQTTILGPMGALAWQRPFNSSDYAWYNMEEGRYTGISAIWHVNKQLDWYNGIEFGWGTFFANRSVAPQYITNISYWLDESAKCTRVWTTILTGPTAPDSNGNTTVFELGIQHNWNKYLYTIVDTQMVYSRAPVFGPTPPNYIERAYDIYTYNGLHLNCDWDLTTRLEAYRDVDGGGYAGGFGRPKTNYYEATIGLNYHPTKWIEFRPEIRYDHATNPNFGANYDQRNQLSISGDVLIKF